MVRRNSKRYRIASKFRFTAFMSIVVLLLGITLGSLMGYNDASGDSTQEYVKVVVSNGDTLWSIAQRYSNNSKDIRSLIYEISELNGIDSSRIYAGQELSIPIS